MGQFSLNIYNRIMDLNSSIKLLEILSYEMVMKEFSLVSVHTARWSCQTMFRMDKIARSVINFFCCWGLSRRSFSLLVLWSSNYFDSFTILSDGYDQGMVEGDIRCSRGGGAEWSGMLEKCLPWPLFLESSQPLQNSYRLSLGPHHEIAQTPYSQPLPPWMWFPCPSLLA